MLWPSFLDIIVQLRAILNLPQVLADSCEKRFNPFRHQEWVTLPMAGENRLILVTMSSEQNHAQLTSSPFICFIRPKWWMFRRKPNKSSTRRSNSQELSICILGCFWATPQKKWLCHLNQWCYQCCAAVVKWLWCWCCDSMLCSAKIGSTDNCIVI